MTNKKKIFLEYCLLAFLGGSSFLMWNAIDRAINVPDTSLWLVPIGFFALTFIFFTLLTVISRRWVLFQLVLIWVIFSSLFFVFKPWYLVFLGAGYLLLTFSHAHVRSDLKLNIKVDFYKSIRAGNFAFVLALSLVISSHYFFQTQHTRLENVVPKFNAAKLIEKVAPKIIASVNDDFKNIEKKDLTVDQWILETEKEKGEMSKGKTFSALEEKLLLEEGRMQLEEFSGKRITGKEKMAEVVSQVISGKVDDFIAKGQLEGKFPAIPFAVSIVLFLTLFSMAVFLCPFLARIAQFIFWIFRKLGAVKIVEELRDVEVIQ